MKNKLLIYITLLFLTNALLSQEVEYFDKKGKETDFKNATYFQTISELPNGHKIIIKQKINKDTILYSTYSSLNPMIRDGITKIYYNSGNKHYVKNYHDNKLEGTTKRFYEDGKIESIVSLFADSALNETSFDKDGKEIKYLFDGKPPRYKNKSIDYFREFLVENINYPKLTLDYKISGICKVIFSITELGRVVNIDVKTNILPFKNEIIKAILSTDGKWNPGEMYGEPFKVKMTMDINFNVPK